jgi:outer membrane lipoprotein LolB
MMIRVLAAALLSVAAGCATLTEAPRRAEPFEFMGRVLVHSGGAAFSANTRWVHAADSDELWLLTPTGQAVAQMREDATGATVTGADQVVYRGARVESLSKRALGWELPLGRMQYWVRGAPAPDAPADIKERDVAGKVRVMLQAGWTVSYEYYPADKFGGLPRRMEIVGTSQSGVAQTFRLVIDTWGRDAEP